MAKKFIINMNDILSTFIIKHEHVNKHGDIYLSSRRIAEERIVEENIMGTRSTTTFINKYPDSGEVCLVKIYEQYDGYPSGVGKKLCNFILRKKIINGISSGQFTDEFANGFDDLATMYIAEFKKGIGYFHLTNPTLDRSSNEWCDYNYEVVYNYTLDLPREGMPANDLIIIRVFCWNSNDPIFEGSPQEMMNFIDKYDDES